MFGKKDQELQAVEKVGCLVDIPAEAGVGSSICCNCGLAGRVNIGDNKVKILFVS